MTLKRGYGDGEQVEAFDATGESSSVSVIAISHVSDDVIKEDEISLWQTTPWTQQPRREADSLAACWPWWGETCVEKGNKKISDKIFIWLVLWSLL